MEAFKRIRNYVVAALIGAASMLSGCSTDNDPIVDVIPPTEDTDTDNQKQVKEYIMTIIFILTINLLMIDLIIIS